LVKARENRKRSSYCDEAMNGTERVHFFDAFTEQDGRWLKWVAFCPFTAKSGRKEAPMPLFGPLAQSVRAGDS
jgi:hypothetical protein